MASPLPFEMDPTPPPRAQDAWADTLRIYDNAATLLAGLTREFLEAHPNEALQDALDDFYAAKRNLSR